MITIDLSLHLDADLTTVQAHARSETGSVVLADAEGTVITLYVNADNALRIANAMTCVAKTLMTNLAGGNEVLAPCDLCGEPCDVRAGDVRQCADEAACHERASVGGDS